MSDAAAKTNQPTPGPAPSAKRIRRIPVFLVWLVVLVVSAAAFAGAVVISGGVGGSLDALSSFDLDRILPRLSSLGQPSSNLGSTGSTPSSSTSDASKLDTGTSLPDTALARMFTEQVRSQTAISELVQGHIDVIDFGTPVVATATASVPFHASYRGQKLAFAGVMRLRMYSHLWYLDSLSENESSNNEDVVNVPVDQSVVNVLTEQQASAANQRMISEGLLHGGFKKASVVGILRGAGTATLNVRLTGGTWATTSGRFVVISKAEGSRTYWFLARLDQ